MNEDYKVGIKESLDILCQQRKRLCEEVEGDSVYMGLYENSARIRKMHFQKVIIEWLDGHWTDIDERLKDNSRYTFKTKQEICSLFAENFNIFLSDLLDKKYTKESVLQEQNIRGMLSNWKKYLIDLEDINFNCEKNMKRLLRIKKQHQAEFEQMLQQESEDTYE